MKYDKYGDPIAETDEKLNQKQKNAFLAFMLIQILLIILNCLILLVPTLNGYLCFITAPIYVFMVITYAKSITVQTEAGRNMKKYKVFMALSLVLFVVTALLAIFGGIS